MSPDERVQKVLEFERRRLSKYLDEMSARHKEEESRIVASGEGRASGKVGRQLRELHIRQTNEFIQEAIRLREESLDSTPALATEAHFGELKSRLESHIKSRFTVLADQQARSAKAAGVPLVTTQKDQNQILNLVGQVKRDVDLLKDKHELSAKPTKEGQVQPQSKNPRKIFVVHGRNSRARDAMFAFLRAMDLDPIEWEEGVRLTGSASPYIGEILDKMFAEAQAVIVVFTGDDVARLGTRFVGEDDPPTEKNLTPQARPNVLFEAGLALGSHPTRTLLVSVGKFSKLRPFSDIGGRHIVSLSNAPESRNAVMSRLQSAGCAVNVQGKVDWLSVGDFDSADVTPDDLAKSDQHEEDTRFFLKLRDDMQRKQGNTYAPALGSEEERQAERLVQRGYLKRGPMGGYMVAVHI